MPSSLSLVRRRREPGTGRTPRESLDFVVDGQSLLDRLGGPDLVGCLGWGHGDLERAAVDRLLLRVSSPLPTGRVPLYVCGECGDLGCGAITARIERVADAFVWSDFGMENDYEGEITRYPAWSHVGPFRFHKQEYWQALSVCWRGERA